MRTSHSLSEDFLHLPSEERKEVYDSLSSEIGLPPEILEKDVWICWALEVLFSDPAHLPMAFKGGTSLSKVYRAISRFSEDIDLTVAVPSADFSDGKLPTTRGKIDKLRAVLSGELADYLRGHVAPLLYTAVLAFPDAPVDVVLMEADGETIVLDYPSCYEKSGGYLRERVKLEFGARNILEPNERHDLVPFLRPFLRAETALPTATVDVLSAKRTFWEKATLAHDACGRDEWRGGIERLSRHWYDLGILADHAIGTEALADRSLLADVVRIKTVFFKNSTSDYAACLTGGIRILPGPGGLVDLERDYNAMTNAGMFSEDPPTFELLVERLARLENEINRQEPSE